MFSVLRRRRLHNGFSFAASNCAKLLVLIFILGFTSLASGQHKPDYTLLWKITGKDLTKPSYLFGTMHVRDKRVFDFSDSVMVCIQKCDAFTLEVHPDSLVQYMLTDMRNQDPSRDLHKILSDEQYAKLAKRFETKHGYQMSKSVNPAALESMLNDQNDKPDDKITFVDAYLYGIARTLQKDIYGLEKASDQANSLNESDEILKQRIEDFLGGNEANGKERETLTDIYATGSLKAIYNHLLDLEGINATIIGRNRVMVNSMLKIMTKQSLFTAVGVAHLPGEGGVIDLLRQAGYTVTPVNATFTGIANSYVIDHAKMKWHMYEDKEHGYTVEFPSEPFVTDLYTFKTVISPDLSNEVFFGALTLPAGTAAHPASLTDAMTRISQWRKGSNIISKKLITLNGMKGMELMLKSGVDYMRMQFVLKNNLLYALYLGNKKEVLQLPYANRFFSSLKITQPQEKPVTPWIDFKDAKGGFSVKVPVEPKYINKQIANPNQKDGAPYVMNMYVSTHETNMANYLLRYNDYPEGYYLADKNLVFNSMVDEFKQKGSIIGQPKKIWKDGNEGRAMTVMLSDKSFCEIQVYVRGNRLYLLMRQDMLENKRDRIKDDFFKSFSLLPHRPAQMVTYKPQGDKYSISTFSAAPKIVVRSAHDATSYLQTDVDCYSTNPNSGGVYTFEHATISKYYRTPHIDSLYKNLINGLADGYKILKTDTVTMGGLKGREYITQTADSTQNRRHRVLFTNNEMYYMSGRLGTDELYSADANNYFNSLNISKSSQPFDLSGSKTSVIMSDLLSPDTSVYKYALGSLNYYDFEKQDLPAIYQALQKSYPDDTTDTGARQKLLRGLVGNHDAQTLSQLLTIYPTLQGKDYLKALTLKTMAKVDQQDGYKQYLNLLTTGDELQLESAYNAFAPLHDSLAYAAAHFEQLLPLMKHPKYRSQLLSLANSMLTDDNQSTYLPLVKNHFKALTAYGQADLNQCLAQSDTSYNEWSSYIYRYLTLMSKVKGQPLTAAFTSRLIGQNKKTDYHSNALAARIHNQLTLPQLMITQKLADINSRYMLMEAFSQENQLGKVSGKYKTQAEFARLCMYEYLGEYEDAYPNKLYLLGSVMQQGKVYYAFGYRNEDMEDNQPDYIGIAGPFKAGSARLDFSRYWSYSNSEVKKANWRAQAIQMIPVLKEQYSQ
ncbi:TraB/GumN family protein [Mucilaginibacter lacusdianchii]|uniref:TraB/GumN family protein n=1 Tax=Mucilaginibacter lacusdianchii TaxID=2684211 RepID=UPI00131DEF8B|nr:TraB/GumN family protein [Mucilaginibacter sp. JXJ CY 39]